MERAYCYQSNIQQIPLIQKDIELLRIEQNLSRPQIRQILMIIEELFSILVHNPCPPDTEHMIGLHFNINEGVISVTITDNGLPFNPINGEKKKSQDLLFDDTGRMGIELIRTFTDSFKYLRDSGKNIINFQKKIKSQSLQIE